MKKIDIKDKKTKLILLSVVALLVVVIVLFATGAIEDILAKLGLLKTTQVEPEVTFYEHIPKGDGDVYIMDDYILVADQVGVACYSLDGEWQWNQEINLKSPVFIQDDEDNVVLGDIGGNGIYGFNKEGLVWRYISDTKIVNVSESVANKQLIIIHDGDNYLSVATLIDFSQEPKVIAGRKFSKYYMMAASISEDGEQAAITGILSEEGKTSSVVVFMKMDGYELLDTIIVKDEFLPVVLYTDEESLVAVGGESIRKMERASDTEDNVNDLIWDRDGGDKGIVAFSKTEDDEIIAVSEIQGGDISGENSSTLNIYSSEGALEDTFSCYGGIKGVKKSGKIVVVYGENEIFAYNIYGQLVGSFNGVSQISDVEFISDKVLVVCGTSKIAKVDFS